MAQEFLIIVHFIPAKYSKCFFNSLKNIKISCKYKWILNSNEILWMNGNRIRENGLWWEIYANEYSMRINYFHEMLIQQPFNVMILVIDRGWCNNKHTHVERCVGLLKESSLNFYARTLEVLIKSNAILNSKQWSLFFLHAIEWVQIQTQLAASLGSSIPMSDLSVAA